MAPLTFDRKHQKNHGELSTRQHQCDSCDMKFHWPKDLRRHKRSKHGQGEEMYYCPIRGCRYYQQGFPRRDKLTRHWTRKHVGESPSTSSVSGFDTTDTISPLSMSTDSLSQGSSLSDGEYHAGFEIATGPPLVYPARQSVMAGFQPSVRAPLRTCGPLVCSPGGKDGMDQTHPL